jgi:creatinine amidohydrolase
MRGALVAELTWPEVERRLAAGATALLPIGSAAKEHGRHLPMATDWLTAEWLARAVAERADVLAWPTLGYGFYPAFVDYPGSTSVARPTFEAVVRDLIDDLLRAGAGRVVVLDTGISTIAPVDAVIAGHPEAARLRAVHVYRCPRYVETVARIAEQERGGHADEIETSVMLVVRPDAVDLAAASPWTAEMRPGKWQRTDPAAPNYAPAGHFGDPTRARREKGEQVLAAMVEELLAALSSVGC